MSAPFRTFQRYHRRWGSAAPPELPGNLKPRCHARVLACSLVQSQDNSGQGQGDLTWTGQGSSAKEGMPWTAPLRGVCSSGCPWITESSSSSPGDGGLAPSMNRQRGTKQPARKQDAHTRGCRVQSGLASSHSTPGRGGLGR